MILPAILTFVIIGCIVISILISRKHLKFAQELSMIAVVLSMVLIIAALSSLSTARSTMDEYYALHVKYTDILEAVNTTPIEHKLHTLNRMRAVNMRIENAKRYDKNIFVGLFTVTELANLTPFDLEKRYKELSIGD